MFDFGIEGYRPQWLVGRSAIVAAHGNRLRNLIGRRLTRAWLVWDIADNEWFADSPVLLDFDGEQLEVNHQKFDDLSITWNTIDPRKPIRWPGEEFDLEWRQGMYPKLAAFEGQVLQDVEPIEVPANFNPHEVIDVGFRFPNGKLTISNGLDVNTLIFDPPK